MVVWKELDDFAMVQNTKNRNHITENAYSITQAGLVPTKSFFKDKTNVTSSDTSGYYIVKKDWFVYSPSRIDVGSISYLKDEGPVIVSPIDVVFSIDTDICLPAYLLSYLTTYEGMKKILKNREGVEGTGRRNLPFKAIKSIKIPLPSIKEQKQIINKINAFNGLVASLAEEIELRKKQFEYYRNILLNIEGNNGVVMKSIDEIKISLRTGLNPRQSFKLNTPDSTIPYVTGKEIYNNRINISEKTDKIESNALDLVNKRARLEGGLLLFASTGCSTVGRMAVIDEYNNDWAISETLYAIKFKEDILPEYVMHCLYSEKMKKQYEYKISRGSVPHLKVADLMKVSIPVCSPQKQAELVEELNTFTSLISKLEEERDLRQKQYEYYREKLLTFE